jgi:hypothetical protein
MRINLRVTSEGLELTKRKIRQINCMAKHHIDPENSADLGIEQV